MYDKFYDLWLGIAKQAEQYLLGWNFKAVKLLIRQSQKPVQDRAQANFASAALYYMKGIYEQRRGFYRMGVKHLQKALELVDGFSEKSSIDTRLYLKLKILYGLGNCEIEMDLQDSGFNHLTEAKDLRDRHFADYQEERATIYIYLGTFYGINGYYDRQKFYYKKALKIIEGLPGENELFRADCLEYLGYCEANLGNYTASEKYHCECLIIRKKYYPDDHPAIGKCLNNQGFLLRKSGQSDKALRCHLKALEIFENFPLEHHLVFRIIFNLAKAYKELGELDQALKQFQKVKDRREKAYGKQHRHIASTLVNIGRCHSANKQYEDAIECISQSLKIREATWGEEEHRYTAKCHYDLSEAYLQSKDYDLALYHAHESLRINNKVYRSEFNGDIAADQNLIAGIIACLEKYNEAKEWVEKNLKNGETLPKDILIKSYEILGEIHFLERDFGKAYNSFLLSLELKKLGISALDSSLVNLFNSIGESLLHQGKYKEALEYFQKTIASLCGDSYLQNVFKNPLEIDYPSSYRFAFLKALQNKVRCFINLYRQNEGKKRFRNLALSTFKKATLLMENALEVVNPKETKLELLNEEKGIYEDIINLIYDLYQQSNKTAHAEYAFYLAEQRKGILLLKSQLNSYRMGYLKSVFGKPKHLLEEIQTLLGPTSCLVEFFVGKHTTFLFCIKQQNIAFIKISEPVLGESKIRRYCEEFNTAFENWSRKTEHNTLEAKQKYLSSATKLYKLLIAPINNLTSSGLEKMVIIPDGPLFKISFGALIKPTPKDLMQKAVKDFPFLIKDYPLYYQYSAKSLLATIQKRSWAERQTSHRALVIEPSDFDDDKNLGRLNILPIWRLHQKYLDHLEELTGDKATLKNVLRHLPNADYILGYSHCKKNENGEVYILLAGGEKLMLSDLQSITCKADLVLLICCGGGVGPLKGREGMFSFSRAFLEAGALNVCSSLSTQVFDDAARQLLKLLVQRTIKKMDNAQALREAQLQLLEDDPKFLPIDVLSFVMYGGWKKV